MVGLKVGDNKRQYTVHEDLLCANSKLFKRRLQDNRKPVEGECSICHESLDETDDTTFCRSGCGQNFHPWCIDGWRQQQRIPGTCPICRKPWRASLKSVEEVPVDVDPGVMMLYVAWLYTGKVQDIIGVDYSAWDEAYNVKALQAWNLAVAVDDVDFKLAVIADIIARTAELHSSGFWQESASYAFVFNSIREMQEFVAEAFLVNIDHEWFREHLDEFPDPFTREVGLAAIRALGKEKPTRKDLLKKYTKGTYEMEEEEDGKEEDGEEGSDDEDGEDA
jgi:hypothetical protein